MKEIIGGVFSRNDVEHAYKKAGCPVGEAEAAGSGLKPRSETDFLAATFFTASRHRRAIAPWYMYTQSSASDDRTLAELMVDHGVAIHAKNKNGDTPLNVATREGSKPVAEVLRLNGAR